jgi:threonylcarbamoyladenosine tRNA methylthiotransferase MtaB
MDEVDLVIGNAEKLKAECLRRSAVAGFRYAALERQGAVNDIMAVRETGRPPRSRGWTGIRAPSCRCRTAATIAAPSASSRSAAAPSRSVPMGEVVEQIRRLVGTAIARWC